MSQPPEEPHTGCPIDVVPEAVAALKIAEADRVYRKQLALLNIPFASVKGSIAYARFALASARAPMVTPTWSAN